ncbi:hypothetical protein MTO96_033072 [Rhipicephalus appendiculatus]
MAEKSARKRRKVYLEGDAYFAVPTSTLYRHEKAHEIASAASRTLSTSAGTNNPCGNATPVSPSTPQSGPNDGDGDEVSADDYCSNIPSLDSDEEAITSEQCQSATPGSPNTVEGSFSDDDVDEAYFDENCGDNRSDEQSSDGASDSSECGYSCDGSSDGSGDGCTRDSSQDSLPSWFARFGSESLPHSNISKAGAVAAVMSFAVTHGLTWTAMGGPSQVD